MNKREKEGGEAFNYENYWQGTKELFTHKSQMCILKSDHDESLSEV